MSGGQTSRTDMRSTTMSYTTTRPTAPTTMLLALLVAFTAFFALAALTSAKDTITYPTPKTLTPKNFADGCNAVKGSELIEMTDASGKITSSSCTIDGGVHECNWVEKTCTDSPPHEPTSGGVGRVPVDGVLVDDTPATQPGLGFGGVAAPPTGDGAILDGGR
jgi:hypothetical protein